MTTYTDHLIEVALAAHRAGHPAEAEATLHFILGRGERDAWATYFIGHLCYLQGRLEDARRWLSTSIAQDPNNARAHNDLGETLRGLGFNREALPHLERTIALEPGLAHAYGNMAAALVALNRPEEALLWAQKSIGRATDKSVAHCDLGSALGRLNRQKEAIHQYRLALAIDPDNLLAQYFESLMRLSLGDMPAAWSGHECRLAIPQGVGGRRPHIQPLWRGEQDLAGKRILLHAEQGLGDTLQFVRYAPMVAALGATVILEVQPGLTPALRGLSGIESIHEFGGSPPNFDLHCPIMSLPAMFETALETIPAKIPYLTAEPDRLTAWKKRLGPWRKMRIGLAWSGREGHASDLSRSIALASLIPLLSRGDVECHVVQRDIRASDRETLSAWPSLADHSESLNDFAETAALVAAMDLIVSVDTAIAHLAGALGRPTWVLLAHSADWRWMRDRADSPWYPTSRLFRQPKRDDWQSVLDTLMRQLDRWSSRQ
jgi:Flp pilus assembly protein TadD